MDNDTIKNNIANLLKKYGYTQQDLADRTGYSRQAINSYLTGGTPILKDATLDRFASSLQVSRDVLMQEDESEETQAMKRLRRLYQEKLAELESACKEKADMARRIEYLEAQVEDLRGNIKTLREIIAMKDKELKELRPEE